MRKSIKAALFSILVFPGAGHFSLKRYQRGMIFFVPAMLSLLYLINYSLNKAYAIADQVTLGSIPLDPQIISNLTSATANGSELFKLQAAIWVMGICWIIGTIDSFRLGYIADQNEKK